MSTWEDNEKILQLRTERQLTPEQTKKIRKKGNPFAWTNKVIP